MATPMNWRGKPPKEFALFEGCDYKHWLIVMDAPAGQISREEIIANYVRTLAIVMGSDEEAKKAIYSVSTRHYFAFGCKISEELSEKLKPLTGVRFVLPDSYLDPKTKSYGGQNPNSAFFWESLSLMGKLYPMMRSTMQTSTRGIIDTAATNHGVSTGRIILKAEEFEN